MKENSGFDHVLITW